MLKADSNKKYVEYIMGKQDRIRRVKTLCRVAQDKGWH